MPERKKATPINIPQDRIAQHPCSPRDHARLLYCQSDSTLHNRHVYDIPSLIRPGDIIVYNDCRVIPARLWGRRSAGKARTFELLLLSEEEPAVWQALVKPLRRLKEGERLICSENLAFDVVNILPDKAVLRAALNGSCTFDEALSACGVMPIPPYLGRQSEEEDKNSYQTVFAKVPGAVAAPTAGLHFTHNLIHRLRQDGVALYPLSLLVSGATFLPLRGTSNELHSERYFIPASTWRAVEKARQDKRRIIVIGTTTLRALESEVRRDPQPDHWHETRLFIRPPFHCKLADVLMTNFHLPESSLIKIIESFLGEQQTYALYKHALDHAFRFYSYGDCCWLEQPHT